MSIKSLQEVQEFVDSYLQGIIKSETLEEQLFTAIKRGDENEIKQLLQNPALNIRRQDRLGNTALHVACAGPLWYGIITPDDFKYKFSLDKKEISKYQYWTEKYLEIIKLLLAHGADINAQNNIRQTPLHQAVEQSRSDELTNYLLNSGADLYRVNDKRETVLHLAVTGQINTLCLVKLLLSRDVRKLPYLAQYVGQYYRENKTILINSIERAYGIPVAQLMAAVGHFNRATAQQIGTLTLTQNQNDGQQYIL
jgi:hypothetical protein